ncbi:Acyl-CoA thioesterase [Candidatus Desulfarcum epimagneticum]|uniref:Acyl-CoA thioesterase n=1 Tax=uncultured Desulfobacteraceae bacterium TaxID=218296 RepID=A0A484HQE2_9BACT|nr:Acyl-CoA thioesterase [uncultured Desulfobacteraceae bacterium]
MQTPKPVTVPIPVRFSDLDAMNHVNNAVFFTYFEEGRKFLFHDLEDFQDFSFILGSIDCRYIRPVTLESRLQLEIGVDKIGTKSFDLLYRLADASDPSIVFATGRSTQVWYDYEKNLSVEIGEAERKKLEKYPPPVI